MSTIYFTSILILILIIWMIIRKKWKFLMWSLAGIGILTVIFLVLFFYVFLGAFSPECNNNRIWKIEGYEIIEMKCLGFAGPPYYPVYLYKNKKKIDELTFIDDTTCRIQFKPKNSDTLTFNLCENQLEK